MNENQGDFSGTSGVVTGASSGIGQAIAIELARLGLNELIVHYRQNQVGAQQTVEQCAQYGCRATAIAADLSDAVQSDAFVDRVWDSLGTVQTWVNNAGADVLTGDAASWEFEQKLEHLWKVDVVGAIRISRRVSERMKSSQASNIPSITMIGWDQAPLGMEGDAGQMFGPIKAAVMAFANSLAQSVAPHIRVNTVAPGWIQTAWGKTTNEYWDSRATSQSLMQRWGTPQDVARAVCFVASPCNSFATGQTINVNGGWNRRFEKH